MVITLMREHVKVTIVFKELECHTNCLRCLAESEYDCTGCPLKKLLWIGECLDSCPDFTYQNDLGDACLSCVYPCDLCSSETTCISCSSGFYMSETECVTKDMCPVRTYPDDETRYCKECAKPCVTCYGATNKECLSCDFEEGFSNVARGTCGTIICGEGTYRSISFETREITCLPCDSACSSCDSKDADKCIECQKGYISYSSSVENRVKCKDCPAGFFRDLNSECKGTCISLL